MMIPSTVRNLIDELDALGKQREDAWQIPRAEGELLYQIALSSRAKLVVEIGTSYGFSGLFWGAAMKQNGGHLHTIDRDPKKYDSSKLTFTQAGLNDCITSHLGDAHEILSVMPAGIDLAFIDADKPRVRTYFDLIWPKLRLGGSILVDNALTHRAELSEYVRFVRAHTHASSVEVAVGNGLEWTIKLG